MTLRLATGSRSAAADAVVDRLDAGSGPATLKIYSGSQPATPATSPTGTLLATVTLNDPAFGSASSGVATLSVSPAVTGTGVADNTAGWFRAADSDGNAVFDGACGTSGAELNLATLTISTGVTVSVTSGSYTQPMS